MSGQKGSSGDRRKRRAYINCSAKGAISLFMAVLMTPFLTIAMVLVDAGRYNSAVSILDEAMGVSAISTLAHYDSYLQERWGLLAIDQGIDINSTYRQYLVDNAGIMGKSIDAGTVAAEGMYALSENELLYSQILEYCKWNAPTKLATNFLNINDLIKKLESFKNLGNIFSMITGGTNALDATITLVESAEAMKEKAQELEEAEGKYEDGYNEFVDAVDDLIAVMGEEPEEADYKDEKGNVNVEEYNEAVEEWEGKAQNARNQAGSARDSYGETVKEIGDCVKKYKEEMGKCVSAIGTIGTNLAATTASAIDLKNKNSEDQKTLDGVEKSIKELEADPEFAPNESAYQHLKDWEQAASEKVSEGKVNYALAEANRTGLAAVQKGYDNSFSKYSDATFGGYITGLDNLQTLVNNYNVDDITADSASPDAGTYHSVIVKDYVTKADIEAYLEEQKKELLGGSLKAVIEGIISFFNSLVKMSLFYNPSFSAVINTKEYNEKFGGLPGADGDGGGVMAIMNDISGIFSSIGNFGADLATLKLLQALKDLKDLIVNIGRLLVDVGKFALDICRNIGEVFTGYERLWYSTYTTFNLPCRTDYASGGVFFTTMTGFSLGRTSLPDQGIPASSLSVFDDLAAAINAIQGWAAETGDDLTFSGAELEYILYGSKTEISNQIYTFFALYLLRLMLDVIPVTKNPEVQSLAMASTFGYPVVMALEILAEPLVDTVLLVNGAEVPLIEETIYLTPSGLPKLLEGLQSVVNFTPENKAQLQTALVGAFDATDDDYNYQHTLNENKGISVMEGIQKLTKFNYREYCFMLMLLTVKKEQQLARLKNLIQMETYYHYKEVKKTSYLFDMRNSYTFLHTKVSGSVKQMLPSMLDSARFRIQREQYRGY